MDTSFSPNENYPFLSNFILPDDYENQREHRDTILRQLDQVWQNNKIKSQQTYEYLVKQIGYQY